ncbi:MAG: copper chaperone PCu(A)C [Nakamurella sp.]
MSRAAGQPAAREPRSGARRGGVKVLAAVSLGAALLLSGCAAGQISQTAQEVAAIDGGNATVGDIGVRNALLATPDAANYAKGSNVKLLLVLSNDGTAADTLTSISTPAAGSVKLSGAITLPAQSLVTISADSTASATLTGTTQPLCYGQSIPLSFSFAQAGQLTLNVPIRTPAERTGSRDTINIQPPELTPLWLTGKATSSGASAGVAGSGAVSATAAASQSGGASAAPPTACNG